MIIFFFILLFQLLIDPSKLLPLKRFLPQQPRAKRCLVFSKGTNRRKGNGQHGRRTPGRKTFRGSGRNPGRFNFKVRRGACH